MNDPKSTPKDLRKLSLIGVMFACLIVGIGGIILAAALESPADGGRGGALAVALAFGTLFLGSSTPQEVLTGAFGPRKAEGGEPLIPAKPSDREIAKSLRESLSSKQADVVLTSMAEAKAAKGDVGRMRAALASHLGWSKQETVYLSIASISGTLIWGFGDWIAEWLMPVLHSAPTP